MAAGVLELLSPHLEPLLEWVMVPATLAAIFWLPREKSGKHRHPEKDLVPLQPCPSSDQGPEQ